jgi:hypothetical protein
VHVGKIYMIYKTSRISRTDSFDEGGEEKGETGEKESGDLSKHYMVEESHADNFLALHVRMNLVYHHFPSNYKKGLEQSLAWMKK